MSWPAAPEARGGGGSSGCRRPAFSVLGSHQLPPEHGDRRVTAHTFSYCGVRSNSKLTQREHTVYRGGKRWGEREGKLKLCIFFWDYQNCLLQNEQMAWLKPAPFPESCCIPKSAPAHEIRGGSGAPDYTKQYWQTTWQSKGTRRSEGLQHQARYEERSEKNLLKAR